MSDTHDIHVIETGYVRPGLCAAYLVVENGRAALIDCGTATCAPRVLDALAAHGVARETVDWLLVTHVHLDHAGAAGPLMQALPNAKLVVHPRGAPHMIDPARLIAGAKAVYGEEAFNRDHAGMLPVPAERVVVAEVVGNDAGHVVDLAGRPLLCIDTPGHAKHHFSVWDARSRSWFAGDIFGISYRELDVDGREFILPTTSPVQFDPDEMHASIERLVERKPASIRIAHYNQVFDITRLTADLHAQVDEMVRLVELAGTDADRHARLVADLSALYLRRAREHGVAQSDAEVLDLLHMDIELNAQGLQIWFDRRKKTSDGP
ncbi:MAG: MBL fold metallo-hydrolase [Pseudoxanthomonas sp.]